MCQSVSGMAQGMLSKIFNDSIAVHSGACPQVLHGAAHPTLDVRHPLDIPATAREADAAHMSSRNVR